MSCWTPMMQGLLWPWQREVMPCVSCRQLWFRMTNHECTTTNHQRGKMKDEGKDLRSLYVGISLKGSPSSCWAQKMQDGSRLGELEVTPMQDHCSLCSSPWYHLLHLWQPLFKRLPSARSFTTTCAVGASKTKPSRYMSIMAKRQLSPFPCKLLRPYLNGSASL